MPHTYRLEELRRNVFLVVAGVIAVFGLVFGAVALWLLGGTPVGLEPLDFVIAGVPTGAFLLAAAAVVRGVRSIRLVVSPDGIALHLPGAAFATTWDNVRGVAPVPWGPLSGEALILERPAVARRAWWFRFLDPEITDRAIPLAPFALPLRGSRLEADLRGHLPELFASV